MVRLRSSRGFGSSGLAMMASQQHEMRAGVASNGSLWELVKAARDGDDAEKQSALERLTKFAAADKDSAVLMIGMGAVTAAHGLVKNSLPERVSRKRTPNAVQKLLAKAQRAPHELSPEPLGKQAAASADVPQEEEPAANATQSLRAAPGSKRVSSQALSRVDSSSPDAMSTPTLAALGLLAVLSESPEIANDIIDNDVVATLRIGAQLGAATPSIATPGGLGDRELYRSSQAVLTNLAGHETLRNELLKRGVIDDCIELADRGNSNEVRVAALGTILNAASSVECARWMIKRNIVQVCVACTDDLDNRAQFMALGALKNILDKLSNALVLSNRGVLELCMRVYASRCAVDNALLALYIIRELMKDPRVVPRAEQSGVVAMVKVVLEGETYGTRQRIFALQILDAISGHELGVAPLDSLVEHGLLDSCCNICKSLRHADFGTDEAEARAAAFSVLDNFARDKAVANAMLWHESVLEICKSALATSASEIRAEALLVLQGLSTHTSTRRELSSAGVVETCSAIVKLDKGVVLLGTLAALDTLRNLSCEPEVRPVMVEQGVVGLATEVLDAASNFEARSLALEIRGNLVPTMCCVVQ